MSYRPDSYVQGDSFYRAWRIEDEGGSIVSLTGADARLQIRDGNANLLAEATISNGRVTINNSTGEVIVNIPHANMTTVTTTASPCYYDLEITFASGRRLTVDRALLTVLPQHTI